MQTSFIGSMHKFEAFFFLWKKKLVTQTITVYYRIDWEDESIQMKICQKLCYVTRKWCRLLLKNKPPLQNQISLRWKWTQLWHEIKFVSRCFTVQSFGHHRERNGRKKSYFQKNVQVKYLNLLGGPAKISETFIFWSL